MKNILFPRKFRIAGWIIFIPSLIIGILCFFELCTFTGTLGTIINDIIIVGITLGALFIVCSRERVEDEMTRSIRLASLLNSLYIYAILLITLTLTVNGIEFIRIMTVNLVMFPLIFVFTFRLEMRRYYKMTENEE